MLFRQIIHEDLGCASYLVADRETGRAVVIDPQWNIGPYRRLARLHGVTVSDVLETHNHADHVSGHGRIARPHRRHDPRPRAGRGELRPRALRRRLGLQVRRPLDRSDPHPRPPSRAHLLPAARCRPRRRPLGPARRRFAVHRRRRPPRPGDRAAPGGGGDVPVAARAPARARRRGRGLARPPRRLALRRRRGRPQDLLDDRLRAPPQPRPGDPRRGRVRRGRDRLAPRPPAQRRADRRPQPGPAGRRLRHPRPALAARGRGGGHRRRRRPRRPHQRGVRRIPHRRRPEHLLLRHRLRDQGLAGGAAGGRGDRRRRPPTSTSARRPSSWPRSGCGCAASSRAG